MKTNYPVETETLLKWTWAEIEPYYQQLQSFELDAGNVDAWSLFKPPKIEVSPQLVLL